MHCPNVVFISEVRQQKFFMENIGWRIGFRNCYPVPVKGKGGGLALYWDDSVTVDLASFSIHHIDVKINEQFGMKRVNLLPTWVATHPSVAVRSVRRFVPLGFWFDRALRGAQ
jgi:hypothetical protein